MDAYFYLAKYVPVVLMPITVVLLLLLLGIFLAGKRLRPVPRLALIGALLLLWFASTPLVAALLYGKLEAVHPPVREASLPDAECVVLLGGAVAAPVAPRVDIEMQSSSDRVVKTAQLVAAGKARQVVVSAGNKPLSEFDNAEKTEADLLMALLVAWGVPESAITLDRASRTTRENALNTRPLLGHLDCGMPLLVTSAAHMPRAVRSFNVVGINVIPVSVDVRVIEANRPLAERILPDADALAMTSDAIREWLGQLLYRVKGWN